MSKTSERLECYQTQMSIYAEQHKIILASDALDMIEQLQDDLKDDINAYCEWKDDSVFTNTCIGEEYICAETDKFKYCPYCGKKIKVVS